VANVLLNYIHFCSNDVNKPIDYTIKPSFDIIVKGTAFKPIIFTHDVFSLKIPQHKWSKHTVASRGTSHRALLVRDPRDVLVSLYHHAIGRSEKSGLDPSLPIGEFLRSYELGLPALINFLNIWADAATSQKNIRVYRYENLLLDSNSESGKGACWPSLVNFVTNLDVNHAALKKAIAENNIDTLRKRLSENGDTKNTISSGGRIRKGKIGSFADEIQGSEIQFIQNQFSAGLNQNAKNLIQNYFAC
jgi:hypothetical protein